MTDSFPWFKFTVLHWMLGRIQRLSFAHQGAFMRLICIYWTKEGKISIEDAELECTEPLYKDLVKYRIVKEKSGHIQIDFMDELLSERGDVSNQKRDAALERWRIEREKQMNAQAMHVHTDAMQIREEEIREEKKDESVCVVSNETPVQSKRFVPPTFEEAKNYFLEKKWGVKIQFDENTEAERFVDYYTSNDWKVGRNKMKDWQAAVRNWIKNVKENGTGKQTTIEKRDQSKRDTADAVMRHYAERLASEESGRSL